MLAKETYSKQKTCYWMQWDSLWIKKLLSVCWLLRSAFAESITVAELKAVWKENNLAFKVSTSLTSHIHPKHLTDLTCLTMFVSFCSCYQGLRNGCHEAMLSKLGLAVGFEDKWSGWWSCHSIRCENQSGQEKIFRFGLWKVFTFVSSLTGNLNLTWSNQIILDMNEFV